MQRTLLALALIVTAGASYAQTMQGNEPRDPYGRPLVGRNDWVRQPGDQAGPGNTGMSTNTNMNANTNAYGNANMAPAPAAQPGYAQQPAYAQPQPGYAPQPNYGQSQAAMPSASGKRQAAFKDEYGFRYDNEGNRLDAAGNIISPHTR